MYHHIPGSLLFVPTTFFPVSQISVLVTSTQFNLAQFSYPIRIVRINRFSTQFNHGNTSNKRPEGYILTLITKIE